ncbi:tRNA pseudouridine(38-40) synthase TruA [Gilvimarinus sp. F26214L]|uniref:tRNA pseudouridine(38-40) synthase TruA n=1 Tax=Gilvimarinus sp. DZF01 TaxID=3461371 RepID=UPI004045942B
MTSANYTRNCELKPGMMFPEGMRRVCLCVEYNGAQFHGFQAQKFAVDTVQKSLQAALSSVADEPITLVCAGRTDAGVHASSQIVHFDTLAERPLKAWSLGVNARLPQGVSVRWAREIGPEFHARFSAVARSYRYIVYNSPTRPALMRDQVTWQKRPMNFERMVEAARCLVGEHDFSSFRASQCQARSPVRHLQRLRFARTRELMVVELRANAFLHHMVRNIMGVLMTVACGDKPAEWVAQVLEARDRTQGGVTAPAAGLYLVRVEYPEAFDLPAGEGGPYFLPETLTWAEC